MSSIYHNVEMVRQEASPVCWLACATMILQYKRRYTPSAASLGIKDLDFRCGSVAGAKNNEVVYATLRRLGFVVTACSSVGQAPTMAPASRAPAPPPARPSEALVEWVLRHHGPFILNHHCGAFWYGPGVSVPASGAHAVVITGIETHRNRIYFSNPWGDSAVPTTVSSIVGAMQRWESAHPSNLSIAYL